MGEDIPTEISEPGKKVEFQASHGRTVRLLSGGDSMELFEFLRRNREEFAEFAPQLNEVETEYQAIQMLRNSKFLTFGTIEPDEGRMAVISTVAKETEAGDMVSLGFAVDAEYRRQGFATDTIKALSENLFKTPEVQKIRCLVNPSNRASRLLLLRCGFHQQGERPHKYVFYDLDKPAEVKKT